MVKGTAFVTSASLQIILGSSQANDGRRGERGFFKIFLLRLVLGSVYYHTSVCSSCLVSGNGKIMPL